MKLRKQNKTKQENKKSWVQRMAEKDFKKSYKNNKKVKKVKKGTLKINLPIRRIIRN